MPQGANGLSLSPSTAATTTDTKSTMKKLGSTKKAMGQGYLRYARWRALRSTFPLAVSGMRSTNLIERGTM